MKLIAILFFILSGEFQIAFGKALTCRFSTRDEGMIPIENCALKKDDQSFQILKDAFSRFVFKHEGLAGGMIDPEGCFWVNKRGLVRKAICIDNGADYFEEGLTRYTGPNGKIGFMDKFLQVKIDARFTWAFPFKNGFAETCMNCKVEKKPSAEYGWLVGGQWSVIDTSGKVVKQCPTAKEAGDCLVSPK
jgi:hypothetical protein